MPFEIVLEAVRVANRSALARQATAHGFGSMPVVVTQVSEE